MTTATLTALHPFGTTSKVRVENAINALQNGKGILLIDNENRENEGDLIFPAQHMTVCDMALMLRSCSGIVCLCLTNEKADALELPYMVTANSSKYQTPFTITIEAKKGITTGISASDRIQTIRTASNPKALPTDLARPGHIFPLRANDSGVLGRNGHTEGSIDLMKLSGLRPEAVLCELTNPDGTVSRLPEIIDFALEQQLIVLSIEDIYYYRKFVTDY
ncbi:3,4-dihydroxy-2-butanone-4-phosphate synthase [Flavobacterium cerinum]|uniref:3,4-dihydroxy-2-butanone 4-phosphate synthase n=1 Tax=Flavobacterium cerinum TaxID=2502784 RepID=A0ABY5IM02_9FLAO|nr:3,4-dihydroxy-2-butanone-4-phosphate synthase [Flavobacterium cerinum]UUC43842.1 3,4-dihydroxy-2-butanone-4-phosphate synthase [Flavobacterium cerinum]